MIFSACQPVIFNPGLFLNWLSSAWLLPSLYQVRNRPAPRISPPSTAISSSRWIREGCMWPDPI